MRSSTTPVHRYDATISACARSVTGLFTLFTPRYYEREAERGGKQAFVAAVCQGTHIHNRAWNGNVSTDLSSGTSNLQASLGMLQYHFRCCGICQLAIQYPSVPETHSVVPLSEVTGDADHLESLQGETLLLEAVSKRGCTVSLSKEVHIRNIDSLKYPANTIMAHRLMISETRPLCTPSGLICSTWMIECSSANAFESCPMARSDEQPQRGSRRLRHDGTVPTMM